MELLIIRHGDAVDDAPGLGDTGRWLSGKGRVVTRSVGDWLAKKDDRRPVAIWSSPLVRAVQTAEILAERAQLTDSVSICAALSTSGSPRAVLREIEHHRGQEPLALVGHEPSLSSLALLLLGAVHWPGFKKSGVLALSWTGTGAAKFRFVLNPKDLSVNHDLNNLA